MKQDDLIRVSQLTYHIATDDPTFNLIGKFADCSEIVRIYREDTGISMYPIEAAILWQHYSTSKMRRWISIEDPVYVVNGINEARMSAKHFVEDYNN